LWGWVGRGVLPGEEIGSSEKNARELYALF
jgi:hypothetical protein